MEIANITYQDDAGNIKVEIDSDKCIACGRCFSACNHNARYYVDDTERFFDDLAKGVPISIIAAPAIRANMPEWQRLFTYLKQLGVNRIYDVALGADICIWGYVRYIEKNRSVPIITQPCPVIVSYCEMYRQDLLKNLSPVQGPMACVSIYMKDYEGVTDRIAVLSPCVAKANEFAETGLAQYNVTFARLQEYLLNNNIKLPEEETSFDHGESGLGALFPMPGGLRENIEFFMGKSLTVDKAEGSNVFRVLDAYADSPAETLPRVFDVLNCREGCNGGTACSDSVSVFKINREMDNRRKTVTENRKREYFDDLYKKYDNTLDLNRFLRKYKPSPTVLPQITDEDIEKSFILLNKTELEKQLIDCGACGSDTCRDMARKIALGVNIPTSCIIKMMEEAKLENENNLLVHEQLLRIEKICEAEELMRTMLDANPLSANFWNKDLELFDVNEATVNLFKLSNRNEYIDNFSAFSPEYQPDGRLSSEAAVQYIQGAFEKGYERVEWMHQTLDGEKIPCEITLVRVTYKGEYIIAAYIRDLREHKKMMADIDKQAQLLNVINRLATVLLAATNEEYFEETLVKGMKVIGEHLEADCVQIWTNEMRDNVLHFALVHKWLSEDGEKAPFIPNGTAVPYSKRWIELFLRNECINGPIEELPQEDQDIFAPLGLVSTIAIPLFYRDKFWGMFCIDDCIKKRYFSEDEINLLNSAGLMLVNAINRNLQISQINDTTVRLKAVVENYPGVICSADKDFKITLFDGLLADDLVDMDLFSEGQDLHVALQKDEFKPILANLKKTISEGPQDCSFEVNSKVLHMATMPILDEKNDVAGLVAKIEDITKMTRIQKELETALEKAESAVHALKAAQSTTSAMFEANPHMNILFDNSFNIIDCNPAAIEFFGFKSKEELLAKFVERMTKSIPEFQSDGRASIPLSERLMIAVKEGFVKFETELILSGLKKNLDVKFIRIPYEDSFAIVGYIYDMTDIRERENELLRAREQNELQLTKLNLVVKATKIGLWDIVVVQGDPVNSNNAITYSSEFRNMLGYTDESEFPDRLSSWSDRLHPEDKERSIKAFADHILDTTGKTPFDVEYRLKTKSGDYFYFHASGETVRDERGNAIRVAGSLLDITKTKNIILDTERQRIEAEAANKAKSAFLSTMSHEIRTPMNAILGITEIQLHNDALDQSVREGFEKIYTSGDMLLGIINDILDLSKIEAGKLELQISKYETASLISDTAQLNMMRIGSKPIEFELNIDENLPMDLLGDELRVKQILNNILSNAFKYTDKGMVRMSVFAKAINGISDKVMLIVSVSDTGQGMSKEQVAKLFDEYSRFNQEANRSTEGTGLGMSITRNLLRLMNGEINIESEPGKGSVFTILLPQGLISSAIVGKEIAESLHKFRTSSRAQMKRIQITRDPMPYGNVLIVDDVEINIFVAKGLLSPYMLKIDSVDSGYGAIERIQNGSVYDIVFMDHMMPKMDGVETTKILREMGYNQPIVALTANAVAGQAEIFLGNGFDDYISKPIDIRQLNAVLNRLIRDKQLPEVIEEARKLRAKNESLNVPQASDNPKFAEIFVRDANKSIAVLDAFIKKGSPYSEEEIRTYVIHTHGVKSALANVGRMDLSAIALKLEQLGRENNIEAIAAETPAFLDLLRDCVNKLKPQDEQVAGEGAAEDTPYLTEKLLAIKTACEEYDESAAEVALKELRQKVWSQKTKNLLETISEKLLHSDFDEIANAISTFMEA